MAFFSFLILTILTTLGIFNPLGWGFVAVGFVFLGLPLLDLVVGVYKKNPTPAQELRRAKPLYWAIPLYCYSITHFALLIWAAVRLSSGASWIELVVTAGVVGMYTGGLGITVAHELCHKKEWFPKLVADLLLSSVCYQHFAVEHVRGHHYRVSTPEDPASSRKGESVYAFWWRAVTGSFVHALEIDRKRVLWGIFLALIFALGSLALGYEVLVFFLLQSIMAFTLLEFVDYIEHYGLARKKNPASGRYEKVQVHHSWNSSHLLSNLILFNLQRHSDHHAYAHLPYTILKHHDEAPQLPSGYPGMILLALIPPLWFKVMDEKVLEFNSRQIAE